MNVIDTKNAPVPLAPILRLMKPMALLLLLVRFR